jgi:hypothetical protein
MTLGNDQGSEMDMADFISQLGGNQSATESTTPPASDTLEVTGTESADGTSVIDTTLPPVDEKQTEEKTDEESAEQTKVHDKGAQAAKAFAEQRVQINKYEKILKNINSILGVEDDGKGTPDEIAARLETKVNELLAKKQGIPAEIFERLNKQDEDIQARQLEQTRNNALLGFQQVKNEFGINDDELQAFAEALILDGKNPFMVPLDLITEYKVKNIDTIVQKAEERGRLAEQARTTKVMNHSSNPGVKQVPGTESSEDKITTVKQLEGWFNSQNVGK